MPPLGGSADIEPPPIAPMPSPAVAVTDGTMPPICAPTPAPELPPPYSPIPPPIGRVSQVDREAGASRNSRRNGHTAHRGLDHVLHVPHGQAVARDGITVRHDIHILATGLAFCKCAAGAPYLPQHAFERDTHALDFVQIVTEHLDAQCACESAGQWPSGIRACEAPCRGLARVRPAYVPFRPARWFEAPVSSSRAQRR